MEGAAEFLEGRMGGGLPAKSSVVGPHSTPVVRNSPPNRVRHCLSEFACDGQSLELGQCRDFLGDHALHFGLGGRPALSHSEAS
jgi:hypothetical protein